MKSFLRETKLISSLDEEKKKAVINKLEDIKLRKINAVSLYFLLQIKENFYKLFFEGRDPHQKRF